jgi:hypothetical protein
MDLLSWVILKRIPAVALAVEARGKNFEALSSVDLSIP